MSIKDKKRSSEIASLLASMPLSENSRRFAFENILKQTNIIQAESDGVRWDAEDIEHIHRMRVASRRLRNHLTLFQGCFPNENVRSWRKEMQSISQILGVARDLDVQIVSLKNIACHLPERRYKAGIHRILLRQSQTRIKTQKQIVQSINRFIKNRTLVQIDQAIAGQYSQMLNLPLILTGQERENIPDESYTPDLYRLAAQAIRLRIQNLLLFEEEIPHFDQDILELHELRKATKWLRYTLEAFNVLYGNEMKAYIQFTRHIQDLLGEMHDSDVWSQFIPFLLEKEKKKTINFYGHLRPLNPILPGIQYFAVNWKEEREKRYQDFLVLWEKAKTDQLFENLLQLTDNASIPQSLPDDHSTDLY